jgi:hypothetical protein
LISGQLRGRKKWLRGLLRFGESCAELANHGDRSFRFGGD